MIMTLCDHLGLQLIILFIIVFASESDNDKNENFMKAK